MPDRLQHAGHPLRVVFAGQHRLVPRGGDERHGGEVVDLVRLDVVDDADQRELIEQVGGPERDAIEQMLDAPVVRGAEAAGDADHLVVVVEQQLRQVRPVLPRDPGDDCPLRHVWEPDIRRDAPAGLGERVEYRPSPGDGPNRNDPVLRPAYPRRGSQDDKVVWACRPYRGQGNRLIEGYEAAAVVRRQSKEVDVGELSRTVNPRAVEDCLVENGHVAVPVLVVPG